MDALLDDQEFLAPFVRCITTTTGRKTIPMETYLGMMHLSCLSERSRKRPRRGKLTKSRKDFQSQFWFKYLQRWRAGEEVQFSLLKWKYGLGHSLFRGTKSWVGLGIFTYNLRRMASLT